MLSLFVLLGTLAANLNSIIKFGIKIVKGCTNVYQSFFDTVAAVPPNLAAHPARPRSVLTVSKTVHATTRNVNKISQVSLEFHHDPGQDIQSGMAAN